MRKSVTGSASKRPGTSPTKKSQKTVVNADGSTVTTTTVRYTTTHLNGGDYDTLQLLLKEKEIELEDKSNTLVGVGHKLRVFEDLQRDVEENKAMIRESTEIRQELQHKFEITANKVKEDTKMKKDYQDSLLEEIKQLKADIQERARLAAKKEQEHIDETGTLKK